MRALQPYGNSAFAEQFGTASPDEQPSLLDLASSGASSAPGAPDWAEEDGQAAAGDNAQVVPVGRASTPVQALLEAAVTRAPLSTIAGADQRQGDLSGLDWYRGNGFIPDLLPVLRALAPSTPVYQDSIWFLYETTTPEADPSSQRVYDFASGVLQALPVAAGVDPEQVRFGCAAAQLRLTDSEQIIDNKSPDGSDPVSKTNREDFSRTVSDALAARKRLAKVFGFDPSDRSLSAVRAMRGRLATNQLQMFLDDYLTAFFVHGAPGEGLKYTSAEPSVFFGNPPGCDQLPDGRGIIDCKGFAAVSQLLFQELSGGTVNMRHSTEITYQFMVPHHQMALIRSGNEVLVVDNGDVLSLAMSQAELAYLDTLHESCFQDWFGGWLGEMAPFEATLLGSVDLNALPSLRPVVEAVFQRQRLDEPVHADWYGILTVIESDGQ